MYIDAAKGLQLDAWDAKRLRSRMYPGAQGPSSGVEKPRGRSVTSGRVPRTCCQIRMRREREVERKPFSPNAAVPEVIEI